ncbi:multicopper oxidase family protein [Mameliella sediminis]|uniref:multicopper oxidase family protein n=1 Tax=Mameliella sediminis TaxID=2836866 RepID=UPI001C47B336|nr:multicopper oxidase family protein [Mameliella sediminis]MBV7396646.1 multicopper oxidase family protein [Mameliella sediminis]
MPLNRRRFIGTALAATTLPGVLRAAPHPLRAEPVVAQILDPGEGATAMFGFNGSTPGPELRMTEGQRLTVAFQNALPEPTAVHWHGIRIDNAMDGVPGLTQQTVPPGGDHIYDFVTPDAGTYWYHSHHQSWEQVARGLYGPLIVEETAPPEVDHDITVILDDWRLEQSGEMAGGFGNMHDFAHAGRLGNFAKAILPKTKVNRGERLRLRIINTATARVFPLVLEGIEAQVVALDGRPLPAPRTAEQMLLAPAQRIDVIGDVTDVVRFLFPTPDEAFEMGKLTLGDSPATPRGTQVLPLPAGYRPQPSDTPRDLTITMEGGAMGGRHAGDDIWAFNGVSGLADAPFARFERGETARLRLINDTAFPHGIHLHGHHFFELDTEGTPGDLRDTTLLMRGETRDILCVFDNPGKWLLHCHMLGHQASGMKTWVEVT